MATKAAMKTAKVAWGHVCVGDIMSSVKEIRELLNELEECPSPTVKGALFAGVRGVLEKIEFDATPRDYSRGLHAQRAGTGRNAPPPPSYPCRFAHQVRQCPLRRRRPVSGTRSGRELTPARPRRHAARARSISPIADPLRPGGTSHP